MKRIFQIPTLNRWLVAGCLSVLAGCGGGGGGSAGGSNVGATRVVQGVAAVGAAVSGTVVLKDADGTTAQATTNATTGQFSIDVTAMTPPFLLRVQNWDGSFLYSASVADGISNVNPLTSVIIGKLSTDLGAGTDTDGFYQAFASYAASVTTATLDRSTNEVYAGLSPAFKAAAGGTDANPIYTINTPYTIGDALDQAFDHWQVYYDASSGDFQEFESADTVIAPMPLSLANAGTRAPGITGGAGTYTGTIADIAGHTNVPVSAYIDRSGTFILYTEGMPATVVFCTLTHALGGNADCLGPKYTIDDHGLGAYSGNSNPNANLKLGTPTAGQLEITSSGLVVAELTANVNATYGNNLKGGAKAFNNSTLGPFQMRTDETVISGRAAFSRDLWFTDANISNPASATCRTAESHSMQLTDLELSTYTVNLHETVTNSGTDSTTCTAAGQDFDMVGGGHFTPDGLLTFLVDRADADRTDNVYQHVAVKLFRPD